MFDYVLRCIDGPYYDKYFHVKTSPGGEVIGGAPDMVTNPSKLTLYIENCNLQAKHASLILNQQCQYLLRDLSTPGLPNSGVWVHVPLLGTGLDLY